jgi:hypothetical protein
MRKAILLAVTTVLIAMLSFTGCSNGSGGNGGSGGSGADFDASLYYTKANIDHYIKDASPRFVFSSATIVPANSDWSTGVALAGANTPFSGGGRAAVVQLTYKHSSSTAPETVSFNYGVAAASSNIVLKNISDEESRTVVVTLDAESGWNPTAAKWWAGSIPSGGEIDINSYIIFYDTSTKKP